MRWRTTFSQNSAPATGRRCGASCAGCSAGSPPALERGDAAAQERERLVEHLEILGGRRLGGVLALRRRERAQRGDGRGGDQRRQEIRRVGVEVLGDGGGDQRL